MSQVFTCWLDGLGHMIKTKDKVEYTLAIFNALKEKLMFGQALRMLADEQVYDIFIFILF